MYPQANRILPIILGLYPTASSVDWDAGAKRYKCPFCEAQPWENCKRTGRSVFEGEPYEGDFVHDERIERMKAKD